MTRRRRRRSPALLAAALACAAVLPGAASASDAGTVTATGGDVTATLSWDAAEYGVANPHLTISRGGAVVYDASIADVCGEGCVLVAGAPGDAGPGILQVADLDADGTPEVLVDTYSGGAHCCITARIYRDAGATWTRKSIPTFSTGYVLKDLDGDGRPEIVTGDSAFDYTFSSFAATHEPPLVYRYTAGKVTDVTRSYPALVRADAARVLRELRRLRKRSAYAGDRGPALVAAYAADEALLGRRSVGLREVDRQIRRGIVDTAFRKRLVRFLNRNGYR